MSGYQEAPSHSCSSGTLDGTRSVELDSLWEEVAQLTCFHTLIVLCWYREKMFCLFGGVGGGGGG